MAFDGRQAAAIFAGGFAGALARTALSEAAPVRPGEWPWTTLAINVAGALLLGWFVTRLEERLPTSRYRRSLLGTGFCGALTTFSTMQLELLHMLDRDEIGLAMAYAAASILAGLGGVFLATRLTRRAGLGG